jgi:hypothetical protein
MEVITHKFTNLEKKAFTLLDDIWEEYFDNNDIGKLITYENSFQILEEHLPELFDNATNEWVEELTYLWLEDEDRETYHIYNT